MDCTLKLAERQLNRNVKFVIKWQLKKNEVSIFNDIKNYFFRLKLYDLLDILHILINVINFVWKRDIMCCFKNYS